MNALLEKRLPGSGPDISTGLVPTIFQFGGARSTLRNGEKTGGHGPGPRIPPGQARRPDSNM